MNLQARISRLEQKRGVDDPFADMSDEELEEAIALVDADIAHGTGMSAIEYAEKLRQEGTTCDLDPDDVRAFVASMKLRIGEMH